MTVFSKSRISSRIGRGRHLGRAEGDGFRELPAAQFVPRRGIVHAVGRDAPHDAPAANGVLVMLRGALFLGVGGDAHLEVIAAAVIGEDGVGDQGRRASAGTDAPGQQALLLAALGVVALALVPQLAVHQEDIEGLRPALVDGSELPELLAGVAGEHVNGAVVVVATATIPSPAQVRSHVGLIAVPGHLYFGLVGELAGGHSPKLLAALEVEGDQVPRSLGHGSLEHGIDDAVGDEHLEGHLFDRPLDLAALGVEGGQDALGGGGVHLAPEALVVPLAPGAADEHSLRYRRAHWCELDVVGSDLLASGGVQGNQDAVDIGIDTAVVGNEHAGGACSGRRHPRCTRSSPSTAECRCMRRAQSPRPAPCA